MLKGVSPRSDFINHMKSIHGQKPSCDMCANSFSSTHEKDENEDLMKSCNICGKQMRKDKETL